MSEPRAGLPRYADLPRHENLLARHAWDVFGSSDQLGRINLIDEDVTAAAGKEVRAGRVINLSLPLTMPDPPWSQGRGTLKHHVIEPNRNTRDDYLDGFYLQGSTQWDGLRHVRARELGYWGGRGEEIFETDDLGISAWAEHGIVTRGVLIDVARHLASEGTPLDVRANTAITVEMLEATLAAQNTQLRRGDAVMIRTGYVEHYRAASAAEREDFAVQRSCPGLRADEAMAEFLWDSGAAAVIADNPALECVPGDPEVGSLHRRLIPLLGFAVGEFFDLAELARECAADARWTCMFVGVPLNLPGGVGSPANSVAVR